MLGRAGGKGDVIGRRRKGILIAQNTDARRAQDGILRSLFSCKCDECNGTPAVAGAIATLRGSAVTRSAIATPRYVFVRSAQGVRRRMIRNRVAAVHRTRD